MVSISPQQSAFSPAAAAASSQAMGELKKSAFMMNRYPFMAITGQKRKRKRVQSGAPCNILSITADSSILSPAALLAMKAAHVQGQNIGLGLSMNTVDPHQEDVKSSSAPFPADHPIAKRHKPSPSPSSSSSSSSFDSDRDDDMTMKLKKKKKFENSFEMSNYIATAEASYQIATQIVMWADQFDKQQRRAHRRKLKYKKRRARMRRKAREAAEQAVQQAEIASVSVSSSSSEPSLSSSSSSSGQSQFVPQPEALSRMDRDKEHKVQSDRMDVNSHHLLSANHQSSSSPEKAKVQVAIDDAINQAVQMLYHASSLSLQSSHITATDYAAPSFSSSSSSSSQQRQHPPVTPSVTPSMWDLSDSIQTQTPFSPQFGGVDRKVVENSMSMMHKQSRGCDSPSRFSCISSSSGSSFTDNIEESIVPTLSPTSASGSASSSGCVSASDQDNTVFVLGRSGFFVDGDLDARSSFAKDDDEDYENENKSVFLADENYARSFYPGKRSSGMPILDLEGSSSSSSPDAPVYRNFEQLKIGISPSSLALHSNRCGFTPRLKPSLPSMISVQHSFSPLSLMSPIAL